MVDYLSSATDLRELPYEMHVLPTGSTEKRKAFVKEHIDDISSIRLKLNLIKVPYLYDPNTNTRMFESKDIVQYLKVCG